MRAQQVYAPTFLPFRWLSAHYAELANGQTTGLTRRNLDGSDVELSTGQGIEYGITLRLPNDRLSLRINKYTTTLIGTQQTNLRLANPIPLAVNGGGNIIRNDLPDIEQAALQAGAPIVPKYEDWQRRLLSHPFAPNIQPASQTGATSTSRDLYDFIVDRESRGYEVSLVGNPTPQWRVSVQRRREQFAGN